LIEPVLKKCKLKYRLLRYKGYTLYYRQMPTIVAEMQLSLRVAEIFSCILSLAHNIITRLAGTWVRPRGPDEVAQFCRNLFCISVLDFIR